LIGPCPGYVVDHVKPLACGGIGAPENMQWQSVSEAKAKDRWERNDCERPVIIPPVALPLEPLTGSRGDAWRAERRDYRAGNRGPRSASSLTATGRRSLGVRLARLHSASSRSTSRRKWRDSLQVAIAANWFLDAGPENQSPFIEPMLLLRTEKRPKERTGYMNLNSTEKSVGHRCAPMGAGSSARAAREPDVG
jgi:hypothetical protein